MHCAQTVSYLRNLFPEASFGDKRLEDINLKILKSDSQCPDSDAMVKILGQIFEAIEKDYLRKLEMGIFSDPACTPESLEESYILRFAATKDNSDGDGDGDGGDAKGSGGPSGPGKDKNGKPKWVVDLGSSTAEDTQNQAMSLLRMLIISCQGLKTWVLVCATPHRRQPLGDRRARSQKLRPLSTVLTPHVARCARAPVA